MMNQHLDMAREIIEFTIQKINLEENPDAQDVINRLSRANQLLDIHHQGISARV